MHEAYKLSTPQIADCGEFRFVSLNFLLAVNNFYINIIKQILSEKTLKICDGRYKSHIQLTLVVYYMVLEQFLKLLELNIYWTWYIQVEPHLKDGSIKLPRCRQM